MAELAEYRSIWNFLYDVPFTQAYVDAGGIRTRYINAGSQEAPPLIMLHGLGGSWENCFGNIRDHSKHFNVFAFDLVGHGLSGKPDKVHDVESFVTHLQGFLDVMKIDKADFIGVSLGSWVITKFATRNPGRVGKVTMISAWGRPRASSAPSQNAAPGARNPRLDAVANPTWEAVEEIFKELISDPKNRIPDLIALRQSLYRQPEMRRSMENIFAGIAPESWHRNALTDEEVKSVKSPYLIVAAVDHKDIFLESSYAYARLIPNSRLIELTGASHWAQWERVEEFNRVNLEFLLSK